jgi:hypothetical protein
MTVYRLVDTDQRGDPAFLECFKSNAEKGKDPRPGREQRDPLVHRGLSVYWTKEQAESLQRRIAAKLPPGVPPKIGTMTARMEIEGPGPRFLDLGDKSGHLTILIDALTAAATVVDIEPIES